MAVSSLAMWNHVALVERAVAAVRCMGCCKGRRSSLSNHEICVYTQGDGYACTTEDGEARLRCTICFASTRVESSRDFLSPAVRPKGGRPPLIYDLYRMIADNGCNVPQKRTAAPQKGHFVPGRHTVPAVPEKALIGAASPCAGARTFSCANAVAEGLFRAASSIIMGSSRV